MKLGELKSKILSVLTESYISNNKNKINKIINLLESNEDLKKLYLFYEEFENNEIKCDDEEKYVNLIENLLINENQKLKKQILSINKELNDTNFEKNEIYECLDILSEKTTVYNLSNKIESRKKLINHLKNKKEEVNENKIFHKNHKLFETILVKTFKNEFYDNLNENEKLKLDSILKFNENDFNQLKESISNKINNLLTESNDRELKEKLFTVKTDLNQMKINKLNYYKLTELKKDLD